MTLQVYKCSNCGPNECWLMFDSIKSWPYDTPTICPWVGKALWKETTISEHQEILQ